MENDRNGIDFDKLFSDYGKSSLLHPADRERELLLKLDGLRNDKKLRPIAGFFSYPLAAAAVFGFGLALVFFLAIPVQINFILDRFL
jgi:hypothetical protein